MEFPLDAATPKSFGVGMVMATAESTMVPSAKNCSRRLTQAIDGIGTINWTYGQRDAQNGVVVWSTEGEAR
jgi:hypothetical protein